MHGGSRQELDDGLRSLLAIGKPDVTSMNDAWPSKGNLRRAVPSSGLICFVT
jgi:hypothetical protein